jgi:hypothetical protein
VKPMAKIALRDSEADTGASPAPSGAQGFFGAKNANLVDGSVAYLGVVPACRFNAARIAAPSVAISTPSLWSQNSRSWRDFRLFNQIS